MNIITKNNHLTIYDNNVLNENVIVYIVQLNKSNGETISQIIIKEDPEEYLETDFTSDGFYSIYYGNVSTNPTMPYYYRNGIFYNNQAQEVDLQEIIEVNPSVSEIEFTLENYFLTDNLRSCFVNICKEVFDDRQSDCSSTVNKELTYKRDLIWSAIEVIKYYTEQGLFEEAQRLLEKITDCNGLCQQRNSQCGCR